MTQAHLTSKERVRISLAWQQPDRVPIQIYVTPEIGAQLAAHFGRRDWRQCLGVDFRHVGPVYRGPVRATRDGIRYDLWGAGYRRIEHGSAGAYDEATELPLASLESLDDVERYPWPDPEAFDLSTIRAQCNAVADFAVCCGDAGTPDIANGVSRGRGMEQVLIDIVTRDPVGLAIIDRRCDICYRVLRRTLESADGRVDIVCIGEDMGNQNGRMVSPRDFEEVFRPRLKRFIDLAHEFGARAMMHSCGDTHELMPTLMAMGLDVLDAMQPEPPGMQPVEKIRELCRARRGLHLRPGPLHPARHAVAKRPGRLRRGPGPGADLTGRRLGR